MRYLLLIFTCSILLFSCKEDTPIEPNAARLVFTFEFNPNQARLDNFGNPSTLPANHAAQSPKFNSISANYIELAKDSLTPIGQGTIVYQGPETTAGGSKAIAANSAIYVAEGQVFFSIPFQDIEPAEYKWIRVSLSYQNFDIVLDAEVNGQNFTNVTATAASFIGYNTYLSKYGIKNQTVIVNGNKLQGYVGIETPWTVNEFQAPPGATTVPNPIANSSPINPGSCVVTGPFNNGFIITGDETDNRVIALSLSTNNSFEWVDDNGNGKYEPLLDEQVVDMGIRGLLPIIN